MKSLLNRRPGVEPLFINSPSGMVFTLYHPPEGQPEVTANILFIPPFAEELNRSRHMINRQARAFAKRGYGVLILDLFGTGDSEGTFGEATVPLWQQDILAALHWLGKSSDTPPILWAMRSGALIVADLVRQYPELTEQLILWSPVSDGRKFITQYLRIKLAADLTNNTGGNQRSSQNGIRELWSQLENGRSLEIAGYSLSPDLAIGLSALALNQVTLPPGLSVKWIEQSPIDPPALSPAARKIIEYWQKDGTDISAAAVKDVAFWTLQEPEWAGGYIDQTLKLL